MEILSGISGEEISVIISEDSDQVFTVDDGELLFNEEALKHDLLDPNLNPSDPFAHLRLWLVIPVNGLDVMVLNNVPVYFQDF